jgi:hypothetical protein
MTPLRKIGPEPGSNHVSWFDIDTSNLTLLKKRDFHVTPPSSRRHSTQPSTFALPGMADAGGTLPLRAEGSSGALKAVVAMLEQLRYR